MKRIHVLPDTVKSKIAAGEVIEGPYSIVKELMENSLDAGASEIEVQVFDSGMKKILVRDNGTGIDPHDIHLAITEHATSKINDIHDIEKISSYGFRGEALSSIASVSELTILTRPPEFDMGVRLTNAQGVTDSSDYAGPSGTTIIVENLFFNIPARKKFLKSKSSETRLIREVFLKIALANPGVTFYLDVDGKRKMNLKGVDAPGERIKQIYGNDAYEKLHHQKIQDLKVSIEGYMSGPADLQSSRNMQLLYINGRPVDYRYYSFIINRAYEGIAGNGRYPASLIFITIDPTLVDVNIHPAKREVKLFDQKYIDSLIYALAEKTLNKRHSIRGGMLGAESSPVRTGGGAMFNSPPLPMGQTAGPPSVYRHDSFHTGHGQNELLENYSVRDMGALYESLSSNEYSVMGVAFGTYIVYQDADLLTFIDFHAAHERMIFDDLVVVKDKIISQELLFPKIIELPLDDYYIIIENLGEFSEIGFDIESFSDNSLIIRNVPVMARDINPEQVLNNFIEELRNGSDTSMTVRDKIAASVACHSAKRAGDNLTSQDIQAVINFIKKDSVELRCPHGRPFVYTLSKYDLERLFKRS